MTETMVLELIIAHNKSINDFINGELAEQLHAKNGEIALADWFKAQSLIREQRFYEKGMALLEALRAFGWDVKMNMQSDELVFCGRI